MRDDRTTAGRDLPTPELRVLRDGTRVLVRPILPGDKERLREGLSRLSDLSRYRRCMHAVSDLTAEQLRYFTEIDYADHMAWVALDPDQPGEPGLGVARYVRLKDDPAIAEVAVTVIDSHQGRGLGTLLLGILSRTAALNGVETFRAFVLEENEPMIRIFTDLGAVVGYEEPGVLRIDTPVLEDPEMLPSTPTGRAFREVAIRTGAPAPRPD
jgi:GNAT superfamily N-acetyltransferase